MTEKHLAELAEEYENVRPIPARTHMHSWLWRSATTRA